MTSDEDKKQMNYGIRMKSTLYFCCYFWEFSFSHLVAAWFVMHTAAAVAAAMAGILFSIKLFENEQWHFPIWNIQSEWNNAVDMARDMGTWIVDEASEIEKLLNVPYDVTFRLFFNWPACNAQEMVSESVLMIELNEQCESDVHITSL